LEHGQGLEEREVNTDPRMLREFKKKKKPQKGGGGKIYWELTSI